MNSVELTTILYGSFYLELTDAEVEQYRLNVCSVLDNIKVINRWVSKTPCPATLYGRRGTELITSELPKDARMLVRA